jgi:3-methyladenine DNA glycosylase/8-oxoguanine DNA glycosylase
MLVAELELRGAGGEPVSFLRTLYSHGCASLPPARLDGSTPAYELTARFGAAVHTLRFTQRKKKLRVETPERVTGRVSTAMRMLAVRIFRLEDDLSPFYAMIAGDERLAWAAAGAGRMLGSASVFEDVIKTICTTNCSWSATERMTAALVRLGGGAFPSAQLLARTPPEWFSGVARMGYRGPFVRTIASRVASGALDLEGLARDAKLDDECVEQQLLELPGVGPYAAAHVMQMVGRHRRLVLDSWTRPKYLKLTFKRRATDAAIRRAFARYGRYAGLAFWLFLTRDWVGGE